MSTSPSVVMPGAALRGSADRRHRLAPAALALGLAGVASGGALVALGYSSDHLDVAGAWLTGILFIGWSFIGVGLYAWWRRPDNRFGLLMVLTGFAWFVAALQVSDIPLLFTIGASLSVAYLAVIVHTLLAFPSGRLERRSDRQLAIGAYLVSTVLLSPSILFLDYDNVGCADCPRNVFLVSENQAVFDVFDVATSVLGILLVVLVARSLLERWRAAAARRRRALAPVLAAGGLVSLSFGLAFVAGMAGLGDVAEAFELGGLLGIAAVPWCFLVGLARSALTRAGAVEQLVAQLGGTLGHEQLREALARALGDPDVDLGLWLPEHERYVDARCRKLSAAASDGRAVTPVELEGRRVGALLHDPRLLDEPELLHTVADAAALALERERLEAELRAKVEELRASRARIVEAGYAAARRLERDLHDGAQQRLVSLALTLRVAENATGGDGQEARRLVAEARRELGAAIDELRDFARGLHPGILADRGLDAALEALAARAPLPVSVEGSAGGRLAPGVESAAYFVVSEALTNVAKYAEAEAASVSLARSNGTLRVEVRDDGVGGADPAAGSGLRGLSDRVSALDGRLEVESASGAGTLVRATIPSG